jgi:hypothetical protein
MTEKDICVACEYFDKLYDIITNFLRYKRLVGRDKCDVTVVTESVELHEFEELLSKENETVCEGFRELVVLDFKEYIYNYENCRYEDAEYYLDYCNQYDYIINYLGYDDYYESHIYDLTHFMMTPEIIYEFAS